MKDSIGLVPHRAQANGTLRAKADLNTTATTEAQAVMMDVVPVTSAAASEGSRRQR